MKSDEERLVEKLVDYDEKSRKVNRDIESIIQRLTYLKKRENITGVDVSSDCLHILPERLAFQRRVHNYSEELKKNANLDEQYDSELTELAQEAGKTKDDLETEIATCDHDRSNMTNKYTNICMDILYELFEKVTGKSLSNKEYSSSLEDYYNRRKELFEFIKHSFHYPEEKIENLEGLISKAFGLDTANENEESVNEELKRIKSGKDDRLYDKGNGEKAKIKFLFRLSKKYRKNRKTLIKDCNERLEKVKLYNELMAQAEQDQILKKISHLIEYFTFKEKYQVAILVKKSIEYYEQEIHKKREELPKFTKEEIEQLRAYVHAHYGACQLYDELSEINDKIINVESIIDLATQQQISYQERYGEDITEKIVNSGSIETGYTPEEELEEINKRRK